MPKFTNLETFGGVLGFEGRVGVFSSMRQSISLCFCSSPRCELALDLTGVLKFTNLETFGGVFGFEGIIGGFCSTSAKTSSQISRSGEPLMICSSNGIKFCKSG